MTVADPFHMPSVSIAIVVHSGYGHTHAVAEAVAEGAREHANASVVLFTAEEATERLGELDGYDAIIFGGPTYMGSVSAGLKAFMEASSKSYFERRWQDKVAAGFTNSGGLSGDKVNVLQDIAHFAAQHGMHWVNLGLLTGYSQSTDDLGDPEKLNRLGSYLGVQTFSPVDQGAEGLAESDLRTAAHLGRRVAAVALQLTSGRAAMAARNEEEVEA